MEPGHYLAILLPLPPLAKNIALKVANTAKPIRFVLLSERIILRNNVASPERPHGKINIPILRIRWIVDKIA